MLSTSIRETFWSFVDLFIGNLKLKKNSLGTIDGILDMSCNEDKYDIKTKDEKVYKDFHLDGVQIPHMGANSRGPIRQNYLCSGG